MSRRFVRRPRVRQDIVRCALFIEAAAAERLLNAIDHTLGTLADLPGLGRAVEVENPQLIGLRQLPVSGFEGYLLFYRASDEEIEFIRVLHGARDIVSSLKKNKNEHAENENTTSNISIYLLF